MGRNLVDQQDDYICQDVGHHYIILVITGPVLYGLIVNDVALYHMEPVRGNAVGFQVLSHCSDGILIQIRAPDFLGPQF